MKGISFQTTVNGVNSLRGAFRDDLDAMKRKHRKQISYENACVRITGSINLDFHLARDFPNDNRWDYGVGVKPIAKEERVDWIEIHSANSHHNINEVIKKLEWLKRWIKESAPAFSQFQLQKYIWIASGSVAFQAGSKYRKIIAYKGLTFSGKNYSIGP